VAVASAHSAVPYASACTYLQTDNHASTSPQSFLQTGCPSCHPNNSVEALKGYAALRMSADHAECKYAINTKQYQLYFFTEKQPLSVNGWHRQLVIITITE